jgi:hypothetical protein
MREQLTECRDGVMTIHANAAAARAAFHHHGSAHGVMDRRPPRMSGFNGAGVEIQLLHAPLAWGANGRQPLLHGE